MKLNSILKPGQHRGGGFTLIELLVVIAIIGLLASVVLASLSKAKQGAKNAKKKAEIHTLTQALYMYYLDNGSVPSNYDTHWHPIGQNGTLHELVDGGYISKLPVSPDGKPYYYYNYNSYVILATTLVPKEFGPFSKGYNCSVAVLDSRYKNDKRYCDGFDL